MDNIINISITAVPDSGFPNPAVAGFGRMVLPNPAGAGFVHNKKVSSSF